VESFINLNANSMILEEYFLTLFFSFSERALFISLTVKAVNEASKFCKINCFGIPARIYWIVIK
jgi:hypothetical protein